MYLYVMYDVDYLLLGLSPEMTLLCYRDNVWRLRYSYHSFIRLAIVFLYPFDSKLCIEVILFFLEFTLETVSLNIFFVRVKTLSSSRYIYNISLFK
jgi:hypothetical protein